MADQEVDVWGLTVDQRAAVRTTITSLMKVKREQSVEILLDDIINTVLLIHRAELLRLRAEHMKRRQMRVTVRRNRRTTPTQREYRALQLATFGMFSQYLGRAKLVAEGYWESEHVLSDREIAKTGAEMYDRVLHGGPPPIEDGHS